MANQQGEGHEVLGPKLLNWRGVGGILSLLLISGVHIERI